jgi:hypothetical protein
MRNTTMTKGFTGNSIVVVAYATVVTTGRKTFSFTWYSIFGGHTVIVHDFLLGEIIIQTFSTIHLWVIKGAVIVHRSLYV